MIPPGRADDQNRLAAIRVRSGQSLFRSMLLKAYGAQCAVTGCDVPAVLEAAHVVPYAEGGEYDQRNGLLLRADIHILFDKKLMAFDDSRRVLLHEELEDSTLGSILGLRLSDPEPLATRVPDAILREHRSSTGL